MIVVIGGEAEADLERIADHIAKDSPLRALSFVTELRERFERLVEASNGVPLVPRYEHKGVRRRPHGAYLIFYRAGPETIEVIHIVHGAMNYEPILFPEG
jgi:plasmid stabilization system protein ParE